MARVLFILCAFVALATRIHAADTPRQIIAAAILEEDDTKRASLVETLSGNASPDIPLLLIAWKEDAIFLYVDPAGLKIPVMLTGEKDADDTRTAVRIADAAPLLGPDGKPLRLLASDLDTAPHDSNLRATFKGILDLQTLLDPDPQKRLHAIVAIGMAQDFSNLAALILAQKTEKDSTVGHALREAIALIELKSENNAERLVALAELQSLASIASYDFIKTALAEAESTDAADSARVSPPVASAAREALTAIDTHRTRVNTIGTAFRGLSLGSVLLLAALGLAITFGVMGVINMAHGEIMVVGAYATYVTHCIFADGLHLSPFGLNIDIPGMHATGKLLDSYFLIALPIAFIASALAGLLLERTVIRWLYRRPLESLLATWGVSLVLQQLFRLVFGANNVQVDSPTYLSGHWSINDVLLGWNRCFVIAFAVATVALVWVILNRTPLGLLIRAVMQNREMASCLGVRTQRVNMLTFSLGSGLAGLAGAFLSQIGNVGPSLGQSYIVDCFMTVVVGGVGSIAGTVISAVGIGVIDQSLQQYLGNPVLGKILVLGGIIAFLQWKPAGLFVTKSRALES